MGALGAGKSQGRETEASLTEVLEALEESVKLQSHYAGLLNQYDGGERRSFADGMAWILRLRECKKAQRKHRR
jgi:hypothetical protein